MSNAKHTPGKLRACGEGSCFCGAILAEKHPIAKVHRGDLGEAFPVTIPPDVAAANAQRLAACWNACEGLDDPAVVGEMVSFIKAVASRVERYGMIKIGPNTGSGIAMLEILDRIEDAKKERE